MAETPTIEAEIRPDAGKGAARRARRGGMVPAVIYGGGEAPQTIAIRHNVLLKALKAGRFMSTLINIRVDGADHRVICRDVQRDVVRDLPIHADFLRLSERSRVTLHIPVEFINHEESPGLRHGGVLTTVRSEVEMRVTAGNIPEKLIADLAGMEIGDTLTISHIDLPEGARLMIADRDFMIASVSAPSALLAADAGEEGEGGAEGEEAAEKAADEGARED